MVGSEVKEKEEGERTLRVKGEIRRKGWSVCGGKRDKEVEEGCEERTVEEGRKKDERSVCEGKKGEEEGRMR